MDDNFNLGRHEALIGRLVEGQDKIVERLETIEDTLAENRGARRVGAAVWGSMGGAVIALLTRLWIVSPK